MPTAELALTPDTLLATTRTVRRRLDLTRQVPRAEVEACIRVAQQAPCGTGGTSTHWIVVGDPAVRGAIAGYYRAAFEAKLPRTSAGARRRDVDSARHLARHMGDVPVLVLACLDTGGPLPKGNQANAWGALLPAVWSYMLAARCRGLGTAWTTSHLAYEREIAALLGLPPGVHQGVLVPTAYYLGDTFHPARRPPVTGRIHTDHW